MSPIAKVLTNPSNRGAIAGRLLALAESMEFPVQVVQSRYWGYEVPVELAQALADLADTELAAAAKAIGEPVMVEAVPDPTPWQSAVVDEVPEPEEDQPAPPKRGPGRPRKNPE